MAGKDIIMASQRELKRLHISLYMDKHSTYNSMGKPTIEDDLNGPEPVSEFGRAFTGPGMGHVRQMTSRSLILKTAVGRVGSGDFARFSLPLLAKWSVKQP